MAGCAIPTSSAGHAPAGAKTHPKLTFKPDHSAEVDQVTKASSLLKASTHKDEGIIPKEPLSRTRERGDNGDTRNLRRRLQHLCANRPANVRGEASRISAGAC